MKAAPKVRAVRVRASDRAVWAVQDRTRLWLFSGSCVALGLLVWVGSNVLYPGVRTNRVEFIVVMTVLTTFVTATVVMAMSWSLKIDVRSRTATLARRFYWIPTRTHRVQLRGGLAYGEGVITLTEIVRPAWVEALGCLLVFANALVHLLFLRIGKRVTRDVTEVGLVGRRETDGDGDPPRLLLAVTCASSVEPVLARLREIAPRLVEGGMADRSSSSRAPRSDDADRGR